MPESALSFRSLPAEYQYVIQLAQELHNISITPLQELVGGWSGAFIYLVSVASLATGQVEHLILKLDWKRPMATSNEVTRHQTARSQSPPNFAQVVFPGPENGEPMLALEHKATLLPGEERVVVKAQPFGGAVRILDLHALQSLIGKFHFDSERSRSEQDFRIFIRPSGWKAVRDFCLREFSQEKDSALESDPARELVEEFEDALGIQLKPDQYTVKPAAAFWEHDSGWQCAGGSGRIS